MRDLIFVGVDFRQCMEYCCHIWSGASNTGLSHLDRVQKIFNLIDLILSTNLQPLSHRRNVASLCLFFKYFNGMCSDEFVALVPSRRICPRRNSLATKSHPFIVEVPKFQKAFYSNSFFAQTVRLWNSLPVTCFHDCSAMQKFKCNVLLIFLRHGPK